MFPLRPRSGACCHLGRQMPTGRLLAIIHPAHDDADQNASNDQSRQIVPQQQTPLSERHTAALLQWQPFAAILELSRCEVSPRDVARLIPNNVRGFSLSSNPSIDAAGVQAPATLRLTGRARLADDSTGPIGYPHSAITHHARRIPGKCFVAATKRKRPQDVTPAAQFGRMLPLRQADAHRSSTCDYPSSSR